MRFKTLYLVLSFFSLVLVDGKLKFPLNWNHSWLYCFQLKVSVSGIELVTLFSQSGLHGEIHFAKSKNNEKLVDVKAFLETTIQYPEQSWTWGVHQNPVDYSIIDPVQRCDLDHVGPQIINFDDLLGFLLLPGNESSIWSDMKLNLTGKIEKKKIVNVLFHFDIICLFLRRRKWSLGEISGHV